MLVILKQDCTEDQRRDVLRRVRALGCTPLAVPGRHRTAVCITGNKGALSPSEFGGLPGVLEAISVTRPYKLVSREVQPKSSVVRVGEVAIGGDSPPVLIGGPCSVEDEEGTLAIARGVRAAGARLFRAGAYKPRTSPYSFQGLGEEGLRILARVREELELPVVSEVVDERSAELGAEVLDVLQIGARNMQNFTLLRCVGRLGRPVLLKRGASATLDEWLMAAEYLLAEGCHDVILCERGIRSFSDHARNTLDLSVVPRVRAVSHLPILVDPSHGTGDRARVRALGRAALAAGAHGLLVEAHVDPTVALSDAAQTIDLQELEGLTRDAELLRGLEVLGREPAHEDSNSATDSLVGTP